MKWLKEKAIQRSVHVHSGPAKLQGKVLTSLPMSYLVNLSFRFEVQTEILMSTGLHSALISAFSSAMLLQDTWKCSYLR